MNVIIKKEDLQQFYESLSSKEQSIWHAIFGKPAFLQKITDRVKTFEDACSILSIDPAHLKLSANPFISDSENAGAQAFIKLIHIAKALNEGWKPDWTNSNEDKYYPWFTHKAGSGLSFGDCGHTYSRTNVGSRLCFKSRELAEYAGKQFEDIYRDFLTL